MKKIVPVILLAISLTSCSKINENSNSSNIKSNYISQDEKALSNVKKEVKKDKKYDDLSFIDCYKDIIDSKLPYRIDEFGGNAKKPI